MCKIHINSLTHDKHLNVYDSMHLVINGSEIKLLYDGYQLHLHQAPQENLVAVNGENILEKISVWKVNLKVNCSKNARLL